MDRGTSLYLDGVRFSAALAVFLSHFTSQHFSGGLLWPLEDLGAEGVDVFFVLSGFVIGYAADRRERSGATFVVNRAARLYSVALPAVLATFALDAIGRGIDPGFYTAVPRYVAGHDLRQGLLGLTFLNQTWALVTPVGSNLPYWSLGYEVWYYVIFGIAFYAPGRWRIAGTLIAMAMPGPRVLALFPLWLLGLACWRMRLRFAIAAGLRWALLLGSALLWLGYEAWASHGAPPHLQLGEAFDRPEIGQDYLVGFLFAANLMGAGVLAPALTRLDATGAGRLVRFLAGATFTLYLFHFPLMQFLHVLAPFPVTSWRSRVLLFGGTLVLVLALAQVTERRKEPWRRAFATLLGAFGTQPRAALRPR